ncbi:MAG: sugar transferase [Rhodopseudomonas palustris]|nr:sugar transferase [Rhodopseudomonas palustris]
MPLLASAGCELLLVSRTPDKLADIFPQHACCSYADLAARAAGFDLLVHLAVANTNAALSEQEFHQANVEVLLRTIESAKLAGVPQLVNVSSVHALDPGNQTLYAQSKREALQRISAIEGTQVVSVFLPAVHGDQFAGKLAPLNKLPAPIARAAFAGLAAVRPTVHVSRLADFIREQGWRAASNRRLILADGQQDNWVYRFVTRAIDLAFAVVVACLFWWGLLLIALLIGLQSPGPAIFKQQRVGRNGAVFVCYKFRTMQLGTKQAATNEVPANMVTRIGKFLRRTKLDELPQIWNIFRNEIALIGPRPCLPIQSQLIEARAQAGVFSLKPGISGLAQVNGIDMSDPLKLADWDARYLALQSLETDLRIILAAALGRGGGDRVAAA